MDDGFPTSPQFLAARFLVDDAQNEGFYPGVDGDNFLKTSLDGPAMAGEFLSPYPMMDTTFQNDNETLSTEFPPLEIAPPFVNAHVLTYNPSNDLLPLSDASPQSTESLADMDIEAKFRDIKKEQINAEPKNPFSRFNVQVTGVADKSRVETQIKMSMEVLDDSGNPAKFWRYLEIDPSIMAPKIFRKPAKGAPSDEQLSEDASNGSVLYLQLKVVAHGNDEKLISRCMSCVQRERKTYLKKLYGKKAAKDLNASQLNGGSDGYCLESARNRIVQCYGPSYIDYQNGKTIIPSRITCYCRHHKEPSGFDVLVSVFDKQTGQQVGQTARAGPIIITDDHKTKGKRGTKRQPRTAKVKRARTMPAPTEKQPTIEKVIPTDGPLPGGVEITVLGVGFVPSMKCVFGQNIAPVSKLWGDHAMSCILPPGIAPGPVEVYLTTDACDKVYKSTPCVFFTYLDQCEKNLMELALQVIGMRLTGQMQDAKNIARRIITENNSRISQGLQPISTSPRTVGKQMMDEGEKLPVETLVIGAIEYSTTLETEPVHDINLSIQNSSGHTLLHYAVLKNFPSLVIYLLKQRTVDVNLQDRNGWTPLHFSVYYNREEMTRLLLLRGACPLINNENGDLPIDLTTSTVIRNALLKYHKVTTITTAEEKGNLLDYESDSEPIRRELLQDEISGSSDTIVMLDIDDEESNNNAGNNNTTEKTPASKTPVSLIVTYWFWMRQTALNIWNRHRVWLFLSLVLVVGAILIGQFVPYRLRPGEVPQTAKRGAASNAPYVLPATCQKPYTADCLNTLCTYNPIAPECEGRSKDTTPPQRSHKVTPLDFYFVILFIIWMLLWGSLTYTAMKGRVANWLIGSLEFIITALCITGILLMLLL